MLLCQGELDGFACGGVSSVQSFGLICSASELTRLFCYEGLDGLIVCVAGLARVLSVLQDE